MTSLMNEVEVIDNKSRMAKAGHQEILGETVAKFEIFRKGWNPYSRFLDHEKIDLVARKNTGSEILYVDVQVKQCRLYDVGEKWAKHLFSVTTWGFFNPVSFDDCNPNLVIAMVFVHGQDGASITDYTGDIFLFGAKEFRELLNKAVPSKDQVKVYIAQDVADPNRWYWCSKWNKSMTLNASCVVDVSGNRQNFEVMDKLAFRHKYK